MAIGDYLEKKVILGKPQTFMNLSGRSVKGLLHQYEIPIDHMLIIHDDIDLPMGSLRMRPDGGSGGQKGMTSILNSIETDEFPRIRIGIGRPPGKTPAPDYVLDDFSKEEITVIADALDRAAEAALTWIGEGLNSAMNKFNLKTP